MTTQPTDFRIDGRPANRAQDHHLPGTVTAAPSLGRMEGWTPAHSEAARFVGECFAVGAVLGFVTELARPMWEKRHG